MRISRVRIENFRKFREPFDLDLCGPDGMPLDYVVLAGPNGCGKTTILEAIMFALCHDERLAPTIHVLNRPAGAIVPVARQAKVIVDLLDSKSSPADRWQSIRREESLQWRRRHDPDDKTWDSFVEPYDTVRSVAVEYLSSRRRLALSEPTEETTEGDLPDASEANRIADFKNRVLQQQGRRANQRYKGPDPMDRTWIERLNRFWSTFDSTGTHFELDVVDESQLETTEWDLYLFDGDRRVCSVDALSSGEREVIAMAAPFITREFDGILLFDEPELHMHPEWQGRIVPALRSICPNAQIIVATHSDEIWDSAFTFQRFLLVPDSDPRSAAWRAAHPGPTE